jgi:hypothetical protein
MASCPDHQIGPDLVVDQPRLTVFVKCADLSGFEHSHVRAIEQELVKLPSPNAITYRLGVDCFECWAANNAGKKAGDGLEHTARPVIFQAHAEGMKNCGCNPTATDFIAREWLFVDKCDVEARVA